MNRFDSLVPTPDESRVFLSMLLRQQIPFVYDKIGDYQLEVMWDLWDTGRQTCDGERSFPTSKDLLWEYWDTLKAVALKRLVLIGHWLHGPTHGPDNEMLHESEYRTMCEHAYFRYLDHTAPLLMTLTPALIQFYGALRNDTRRKVLVSSSLVATEAPQMLQADSFIIPGPEDNRDPGEFLPQLSGQLNERDDDILILAAGPKSNLLLGHLLRYPSAADKTFINIGSGLDPLFLGKTRSEQVEPEAAREYFKELL